MMFSPSMALATSSGDPHGQIMDEGADNRSRQQLAARLKLQQRRNNQIMQVPASNNSSSSTVNATTPADSTEDLHGATGRMLSIKNRSAELAAEWLTANYQASEGSHVARENIFHEYSNHCGQANIPALNSASFGKVIRGVFPGITTRRLGTRGNSK
jgi:hypothetical protein